MTAIEPKTLTAALQGNDVRHFSAAEMLYLGGQHYAGQANNALPPAFLFPELVKTAVAADRVRTRFAAPLRVLSVYRHPKYNEKIGGAPKSLHMLGKAIDLSPLHLDDVPRLHRLAKAMQDRGEHPGGLGFYSWGIHLDTGSRRSWGNFRG